MSALFSCHNWRWAEMFQKWCRWQLMLYLLNHCWSFAKGRTGHFENPYRNSREVMLFLGNFRNIPETFQCELSGACTSNINAINRIGWTSTNYWGIFKHSIPKAKCYCAAIFDTGVSTPDCAPFSKLVTLFSCQNCKPISSNCALCI